MADQAVWIRYGGGAVDQSLFDAALPLLQRRLIEAAARTNHYSVGFAAVHQGRSSNFAFINWWSDENELHHHLYTSRVESPNDFHDVTPTGLIACVWDLKLLSFEREAWVDCVLMRPTQPDFDAYMLRRLEGDI